MNYLSFFCRHRFALVLAIIGEFSAFANLFGRLRGLGPDQGHARLSRLGIGQFFQPLAAISYLVCSRRFTALMALFF